MVMAKILVSMGGAFGIVYEALVRISISGLCDIALRDRYFAEYQSLKDLEMSESMLLSKGILELKSQKGAKQPNHFPCDSPFATSSAYACNNVMLRPNR
jgi:hypothetical protein